VFRAYFKSDRGLYARSCVEPRDMRVTNAVQTAFAVRGQDGDRVPEVVKSGNDRVQ
jgi:hypothetical protein